MVDVTLEILGSCSLRPPNKFIVKYNVKTFWCKHLEIEENLNNASQVIRLPLLFLSNYWKHVEDGIGMTLFIESWYAPTRTAEGISNQENSKPIFVGLSRFSLDEQFANKNLNPVWTYLPIDRVLDDSVIGKLGVKISANLASNENAASLNVNGGIEPDRVSSYFSSSPRTPHGPIHPQQLINNYNKSKQVQTANAATPNTVPITNKCDIAKPKTTTTTKNVTKSTSVKKFSAVVCPERDKKIQPRKGHYAAPPKVPATVSHNMMTSPDFPFHIPAVAAAERKIKFDLALAESTDDKNSKNSDPVNNQLSPVLFGYTPYITKASKEYNDDDDLKDTSYRSYIPNKHTSDSNDTRNTNVNEMLSVLDDTFNKTFGKRVEEIREQNKEAEMGIPILHEKSDRNVVNHVRSRNNVRLLSNAFAELGLDDHPDREPCTPRQNTDPKFKMPISSNVPGIKITKYKATKDCAENLVNPLRSPSKRRIVANIYPKD